MSTLTISAIQPDLRWEDKEANLALLEEKIMSIRERTEILILPEMFSTGFSMRPETLAEKMDGPTLAWMKRMAAQKRVILTGSLIIEEEGRYYNRLIWMLPNGQYGTYDKRHRFAYAGEDHHYTAGSKRLIASVKGWKVNLQVCYDLRFPVWARQTPPQHTPSPPYADLGPETPPQHAPSAPPEGLDPDVGGGSRMLNDPPYDGPGISEHNHEGQPAAITPQSTRDSRPQPVNRQPPSTRARPQAASQEPPPPADSPEYDLLIYVANWPERRSHAWKTLLQARAIENQCFVVGVNRVGNDGNNIFHSGDSMIVDPLGEVLHQAGPIEEVFTYTLQKDKLEDIRSRFPFWRDGDRFSIEP